MFFMDMTTANNKYSFSLNVHYAVLWGSYKEQKNHLKYYVETIERNRKRFQLFTHKV